MNIYDIDVDDLIGAVHFAGKWRVYAGTQAEWILNYQAYDHSDPAEWSEPFRGNLLLVDVYNADKFIQIMQPYELPSIDLAELVRQRGANNFPLSIVVDFDRRLYVNGYHEAMLQEYIPPGWTGIEDNPFNFVPVELKTFCDSDML